MTLDDQERWAEIVEYPGYLVSNYGVVKNPDGKILRGRNVGHGYIRVILTNENGSKEFYMHRLVAEYFLVGFRPGLHIKHENKDRSNNSIWNLKIRNESKPLPARYSREPWGRQVRVIETDQVFRTVRECANYIGGDFSNIYSCLRGEQHTHMGYTFEYVEE